MKTIAMAILITFSTAAAAAAQTPRTGTVAVRESDSLLNGAFIGAGVGVASELFICRTMEPWDVCLNDVGTMAKFGALGAAIGMGVDALIRKTVYQSASGDTVVHAAPFINRRARGLRLSVWF